MSLRSKGCSIDQMKSTSTYDRVSALAPTRLNVLELVCTTLCVLRHKSSSVVELDGFTHTLLFVTQLQSRGNL